MGLGDFTPQADAYRQSRPSYPVELIDRLASDAGVKQGVPLPILVREPAS